MPLRSSRLLCQASSTRVHVVPPPLSRRQASSFSSSTMHIPSKHAEEDPNLLRAFIAAHPLGLITTHIPPADGADLPPLQASHVPFTIAPGRAGDGLTLRAHMARQNPQSKALVSAASRAGAKDHVLPEEVLIIFTAPAPQGHVSASWYKDTKPSTAKVVPTWDYAAVQVYGKIKVFGHSPEQEPETEAFLQDQVVALTNAHEPKVLDGETGKPSAKPWTVDEAPEGYTRVMRQAIIGVEIQVTSIEGRFKLNQERTVGDWAGIVRGLRAQGREEQARLTLAKGRAAGQPPPEDLQAWAATVPQDVVKASQRCPIQHDENVL